MKKVYTSTYCLAKRPNTTFYIFWGTLILALFLAFPAQAQSEDFDAAEASPETSIAWLRTQVEGVINSESLTKESNAAKHLLHYLDRALGTYTKGMPAHAARHLSIFIAKVERLQQAHRVSEELCVVLIDTSTVVIDKLHAENALANQKSSRLDAEKSTLGHPSAYQLGNSPNPFNPTTMVQFTLEAPAQVNLTVYDITGREVQQLVNGFTDAGNHEISFDASSLPSGTYLYRLSTPETSVTKKMVLLK